MNQYQKLCNEYPFRIEAHAHTSPASRCSDISPEELVERYTARHCNAVVLTNHFAVAHSHDGDLREMADRCIGDYETAKKLGEKAGLRVLLGAEYRFTENSNDYLVYGIEPDDLYRSMPLLDGTLADFRAAFCNHGHYVLLQAHPFRDGMQTMDPALLDGIEVFNMHPGHNSRVAQAARWVAETVPPDRPFLTVCGTDYHHHGHDGLAFLRTARLPKDSFDFADLLREQNYLFDFSGYITLPPRLTQ